MENNYAIVSKNKAMAIVAGVDTTDEEDKAIAVLMANCMNLANLLYQGVNVDSEDGHGDYVILDWLILNKL